MWFIGVEVEQEKSAPPPKKNPGSAPEDTIQENNPYLVAEVDFFCKNEYPRCRPVTWGD